MKPRILARDFDFDLPQNLIDSVTLRFTEPGHELHLWPESHEKWGFPFLISCASTNGFRFATGIQGVKGAAHFLPINGSVNCHVDNEWFGITVACLVHDEGAFYASSELVTRHGALQVKKGDVFIFDSTKWHGWISHGLSVLASITVKKTRRKFLP